MCQCKIIRHSASLETDTMHPDTTTNKCRVSVSKEITSNTQANNRNMTSFNTDMACNICTDNHHTLVRRKKWKTAYLVLKRQCPGKEKRNVVSVYIIRHPTPQTTDKIHLNTTKNKSRERESRDTTAFKQAKWQLHDKGQYIFITSNKQQNNECMMSISTDITAKYMQMTNLQK